MITTFDPARYGRLYLLTPHDESEVQTAVLDTLRSVGVLAWPMDVGGRALRRAGKQRGGAGPKGLPDVMGVRRGALVAIEVKRPAWLDARGRVLRRAGEPSAEQLQWLALLRDAGACAGVAWGVEDVIEILRGA